jgi:hypothetical protein
MASSSLFSASFVKKSPAQSVEALDAKQSPRLAQVVHEPDIYEYALFKRSRKPGETTVKGPVLECLQVLFFASASGTI